MRSLIVTGLLAVASWSVFAQNQEQPSATDPAPSDAAPVGAEPSATAEENKEMEDSKPPPGYRVKKRGDTTLFCRRDSEVGTRFAVEKCYSEEQLVELELQNDAARQRIDQTRRVCSTQEVCGSG
jgi:hypothetical protein